MLCILFWRHGRVSLEEWIMWFWNSLPSHCSSDPEIRTDCKLTGRLAISQHLKGHVTGRVLFTFRFPHGPQWDSQTSCLVFNREFLSTWCWGDTIYLSRLLIAGKWGNKGKQPFLILAQKGMGESKHSLPQPSQISPWVMEVHNKTLVCWRGKISHQYWAIWCLRISKP